MRDIADMLPQMKAYKPYVTDVANLMEANYQKHLTAAEVLQKTPLNAESAKMQILGDFIYLLRDVFTQQPNRARDVASILRDVKQMPLADFVEDIPTMENASVELLTQRAARLVDESEVMNSTSLDDTFDGLDATAHAAADARIQTEDMFDDLMQQVED